MMALVHDSHPSPFFPASEQKDAIIHIIDCLYQEFHNNYFSSSDSFTSFQIMRLLIPHIESLLQVYAIAYSYGVIYLVYAVMHEATQNIYDNFIVYVAVCLFIQSAVSQNLY